MSLADSVRPRALNEPRWVRWSLIGTALVFLGFFLFLPLVLVFYEAFKDGMAVYIAAIGEPVALAAVRLTLLVAFIAVPINFLFALAPSWAIAKFRFRGMTGRVTLTICHCP